VDVSGSALKVPRQRRATDWNRLVVSGIVVTLAALRVGHPTAFERQLFTLINTLPGGLRSLFFRLYQFANLGATAARGGGMLGEGQGLLADLRNNTLPALNRPLGTIDSILVDAKPNIINATASLAHGMQRLDAYISDEKTVNWINEQMDLGHKLLLRIDDVAGSAVVMASNGEKITAKGVEIMTQGSRLATDVTDFVDGYLKAKPKWYQRFILTPLKAVLGYGLSVWEITKK